jgi:hypothetical protein
MYVDGRGTDSWMPKIMWLTIRRGRARSSSGSAANARNGSSFRKPRGRSAGGRTRITRSGLTLR